MSTADQLGELLKVHDRLLDLVRYCRSTLHEDGLITDKEYADLVQVGSKSARRLESYDALRAELAQAKAKLDYAHSMGLRFGMMQSSDKPEPYLAHDWTEDSDFMRMSHEWSSTIGMEDKITKLTADLAAARALLDKCTARHNATTESIPLFVTTLHAERDAALSAKQEVERERDKASLGLQDCEAECNATDEVNSALKARCDALEKALNFFRCVIKSGEPWTETCERMFAAALKGAKP